MMLLMEKMKLAIADMLKRHITLKIELFKCANFFIAVVQRKT